MAKLSVEVKVVSVTSEGLLFSVETFDHKLLASHVSVDEILAHPQWRVRSVIQPLQREIPKVAIDARRMVSELIAAKARVSALQRERDTIAGNKARYDFLCSAESPIYDEDNKIMLLRLTIQVMVFASLGIWPHQMHDLGL